MSDRRRQTPRLARHLIRLLPDYSRRHGLAEDLEACFHEIGLASGYAKARRWYWGQCLGAFPAYALRKASGSLAMFANYWKTAFRGMKKNRLDSFITVAGFAAGLAAGILIFFWVRNELSFDRFHERARFIHRVTSEYPSKPPSSSGAVTSALLAPVLQKSYPDIRAAVRLYHEKGATVQAGRDSFIEDRFFFADAAFFDVFTFPLLKGDPRTALRDPRALVITAEAGRKYFGHDDPMGRIMTVSGRGDFTITGVLRAIPVNSHFSFDFLASFTSLGEPDNPWAIQGWTYLRLDPKGNPAALEARWDSDRDRLAWYSKDLHFRLQPLTSIHLRSHLLGEIEENGDPGYVAVFSILAFLVILIAAVNFVNLSTARSVVRAREVGLRKVVGATRRQLVRQFLGEAGALTLIAFAAAILLAWAGLPLFNAVAGTSFSAAGLADPAAVVLIFGIIALTSLVAGGYPAFLLSSFRPAAALRPQARSAPGRASLRRSLVVAQFAVSVVLLIMTGVVLAQMRFVSRRDLGFRKDSVIEIPIARTPLAKAWQPFRDALRRNPSVLAVSAAMGSPYRGWLQHEETVGADKIPMRIFPVDEDYLDTLGISLIAGRNFSRDHPSDRASSVLINETAARVFGLTDPIGKTFNKTGGKGTIIGVVKDFHTASLREPILPAAFEIAPSFFKNLIVRLDPRSVPASLAFLAREWRRAAPQNPFQYSFLDDVIRRSYRSEDRFGRVFLAFSALALLIAGLGLFGLSSYSASRRTKEIGIRKVLGASSAKVTWLLVGEMLRLILMACLAAVPLAWWAARTWLQKFAYQAGISAWIFVSASVLALTVGLLTVILHAVRAAAADPVIALKYE